MIKLHVCICVTSLQHVHCTDCGVSRKSGGAERSSEQELQKNDGAEGCGAGMGKSSESVQCTIAGKMLRSVKIHGTQSTVYATHRENLHATQPKVKH